MPLNKRMQLALSELQSAKNFYDHARERLMKAADAVTRLEAEVAEAMIMQGLRVCEPEEVLTIPLDLVNQYKSHEPQTVEVNGEWWSHKPGEPFTRGVNPEARPLNG